MSELFANFEVNRQPRWPIVSKLLAGSLIMHVSLAACVLYVPGLRTAFNLASLISGTRVVDKDYEKTQIGDDVQLVELASDKFHYPEAISRPEGQCRWPPPLQGTKFISQCNPRGHAELQLLLLPVHSECFDSPAAKCYCSPRRRWSTAARVGSKSAMTAEAQLNLIRYRKNNLIYHRERV